MTVAYISHPDCGRHDTGWRHPEHVGRLRGSKTPSELIALLGDTGKLLAAYAALFAAGLVL